MATAFPISSVVMPKAILPPLYRKGSPTGWVKPRPLPVPSILLGPWDTIGSEQSRSALCRLGFGCYPDLICRAILDLAPIKHGVMLNGQWVAKYGFLVSIQFLIGSASGDPDRGARFVDLDGDGRVDVIWSRFVSGWDRLRALQNTVRLAPFPAGYSFAPPNGIYISPSDGAGHVAIGVRILDLNGDGLPDIVCYWPGKWPVAYINTGKVGKCARVAPKEPSHFNMGPDRLRFIDVNGDGCRIR